MRVRQEFINVALPDGIVYSTLNGQSNSAWTLNHTASVKVILNDGMLMGIHAWSGDPYGSGYKYKAIAVDVNGLRPPNKMGKDTFIFAITPEFGVGPHGFGPSGAGTTEIITDPNNYNREYVKNTSQWACNKAKYGAWCTALIMLDGWEIKDDYPW